jgi:hypothetical protein
MSQIQQSGDKSLKTILASKGFSGDFTKLMEAVQADPELSKLNSTDLSSAILSTLKATKENPNGTTQLHIRELPLERIREFAKNISSGAYKLPLRPEIIEGFNSRNAANDTAAMRTRPANVNHFANQGEHWHNINKALGWVGAGMMTLGVLSSSSAIVSKDGQDKTKINVTPLLWTLLQGTMAVGLLYLTVKQPQMVQTALR